MKALCCNLVKKFGTLSLTEILTFYNKKKLSEYNMKLIATLIILLSIFTTEFSESKQLSKANRKTKSYFSEANTFSHKYYPNFVGNRWVLRSTVEPVEEHVVEITLKEFIAGQEVNVLTKHSHTG